MQRLKGIVGIVAAGVAMTIGLAAQDPAAPPAAPRGGFQQQPP